MLHSEPLYEKRSLEIFQVPISMADLSEWHWRHSNSSDNFQYFSFLDRPRLLGTDLKLSTILHHTTENWRFSISQKSPRTHTHSTIKNNVKTGSHTILALDNHPSWLDKILDRTGSINVSDIYTPKMDNAASIQPLQNPFFWYSRHINAENQ